VRFDAKATTTVFMETPRYGFSESITGLSINQEKETE
jgi:hypothetical protein